MSAEQTDWLWWRMALQGHRQSVVMGEPQFGYWRRKIKATKTRPSSDDGIAIWKGPNGDWLAVIGRGVESRKVIGQDSVYDVFQSCCKTPVSYEDYTHYVSHAVWPRDLPPEVAEDPKRSTAPEQDRGIGDNSEKGGGPSPYELAVETVANAKKAFEGWLTSIGGSILTAEQADIAANYKERATKLERRADEARKVEKEPFLEAGREVDSRWRSVIADAGDLKTAAVRAVHPYLKAEDERRRKAAQEAAEAAAKARAEAESAATGGEPAPMQQDPEPTVEAAPVRAGTGARKVSLVTVKRVRIVDEAKVREAFIQSEAGKFAAVEWANKVGPSAPFPIPGTEQFTEEVAR